MVSVEVKICDRIASPGKNKECIEAVRDMMDGEINLRRLVNATGKSKEWLTDYLSTHCPLCDDNVPHEH